MIEDGNYFEVEPTKGYLGDYYGLLSYSQLELLAAAGVITNVQPEQINGTSIDITIGEYVMVEMCAPIGRLHTVELQKKQSLQQMRQKIHPQGYYLRPGEFVLVQSQQQFNLPLDISAEYKLKSSMARIGLEHLNAGWCDPGWHGSVLTLELKNMTQTHTIVLNIGDRIGQVVFFRHAPVPVAHCYAKRGRYNHDKQVEGAKP